MNFRILTRAAALSLVAFASVNAAQAQMTFNFFADNSADATYTPPGLASGTLKIANTLADGTYTLAQTGTATFNLAFRNAAFTNNDLYSDLNNARFVITTEGDQRRLQLGSNGTTGQAGGDVDFLNSGDVTLSFRPKGAQAESNIYRIFNTVGTYRFLTTPAAATPEPGSVALLVGMGITGIGVLRRRRK